MPPLLGFGEAERNWEQKIEFVIIRIIIVRYRRSSHIWKIEKRFLGDVEKRGLDFTYWVLGVRERVSE